MWLNLSHFFIVVTCGYMCQMWSQLSHVQMSVMSKCPWCPNVHDVHDVHDVQMSMMSNCPWCGHPCHVWWHKWYVVTLVTCIHNCHMWSHVGKLVTVVTCGHTMSKFSHVSKTDKKICSHRPYGCAEGKNNWKVNYRYWICLPCFCTSPPRVAWQLAPGQISSSNILLFDSWAVKWSVLSLSRI